VGSGLLDETETETGAELFPSRALRLLAVVDVTGLAE
jgi:hypothetical protein